MPTYSYECQKCGTRAEAVRPISEHKNGPMCCGSMMEQRITAVAFSCPAADFEGYRCVATGQVITSEAQRQRVMKENDLADARDFPAPDFEQMREDERKFKEQASKPQEVPVDLKRAMLREGHGHMLD
jgi:putative FmdB family regulatory protein